MVVPRTYIDKHINLLKIHLSRKVVELMFSLDEVGSAGWKDRKTKKVIVPATVRNEDVYHPVSPCRRQATLLTCASALGGTPIPLAVTEAPIRDALWRRGLRQDEDAMICQGALACITQELFYDYISTALILCVLAVRDRARLESEKAALPMVSVLPPTSGPFRKLFGEK
jgi:hypothetical protein